MLLRKVNILLLLFTLFGLVFTSVAQNVAITQLVKRVKPSVVAIMTYDKNGEKQSQGSGFFIAANRIITNKHVIEDAYKAEIKTYDGSTYQVSGILGTDDDGDLAILEINLPKNKKFIPLSISPTKPEEGERILVIGNPLGLEGTISDGLVSSIRKFDSVTAIQITAPISPGSSGSPVVNLKGQVVGIATSQLAKGQNLNFAMASERISKITLIKSKSLPDFVVENNEKKLIQAAVLVEKGKKVAEATFIEAIAQAKKDNQKNFSVDNEKVKKDNENAIPFFREALDIDSTYAPAWDELGNAYYSLERYKDAINAFRAALVLNYRKYTLLQNLANSHRELKEFTLAIKTLHELAEFDKKFEAMALEQIGDIYSSEMENYKEAIASYVKSFRLPGFDNTRGLKNKLKLSIMTHGIDLQIEKKYYEAIDLYKILIEIGQEAGGHNKIGEIYYSLDQYENAFNSFSKAVKLKPDFYVAYNNLARVYLFGFKDYKSAVWAATKACKLQPDYDQGHYLLGLSYYFSGNKSSALDEYKILMPLNEKLAKDLSDLIYGK